jgi:putative ABC transport system substrate-binding protein
MKKKIFALTLSAMLFALSYSASAQQPKKIHRIGYLATSTAASDSTRSETIRLALRERGYTEGQNIAIEYRYLEGKFDRAPELLAELVRLKVDIIVVSGGTPVVRAAKNATKTIPIVMTSIGDPVGAGLVASLARPGGNVTGFSGLAPGLSTKRLEILKDAVPKLARVGLLRPPGASGASIPRDVQLREIKPAAVVLKLKLEEIDTPRDAKGLASAFQTAKQKQVNGIMTTGARFFFSERKRIVELAVKYRLSAIYFQKEFVDEGGLMSYGVDFGDLYRRAAVYVDRILKGTNPADLPVEQPMKFELVINLKTAKQIGLTIPPEVLARATRLIK